MRKVVMRMTVEFVAPALDDSTPHDMEYLMNESGWCMDNALDTLSDWGDKHGGCICGSGAHFEYVREASPLDADMPGYDHDGD